MCGFVYSTDCSTLGIRRNRCAKCELKDRVETLEDIVGIVHYVISKSNIKDMTIEAMTENILKELISDEIILKGLKQDNLDIIYNFFNKTITGDEMVKDLVKYLEYDPNLYELVKELIISVNNK